MPLESSHSLGVMKLSRSTQNQDLAETHRTGTSRWLLQCIATCFALLAPFCHVLRAQTGGTAPQKPPAGVQLNTKHHGKNQHCGDQESCNTIFFTMDATGNVNDKGKSLEGPICIRVYFNPVQYQVSISTTETRVAGPDLSSAVVGKAGQGGSEANKAAAVETPGASLPTAFAELFNRYKTYQTSLLVAENNYNTALDDQLKVISEIKQLLNTIAGIDPATNAYNTAVNSQFQSIVGPGLSEASRKLADFIPTDKGTAVPPVLSSLQTLLASLDSFPLKYGKGEAKFQTDASCSTDQKVSWTEWSGQAACKQQYDTLRQNILDLMTEARQYATGSENVKALQAKASIVNYWAQLFANLDLIAAPLGQVKPSDLTRFTAIDHYVPCRTIFNQTSSTTVGLVTIDQAPTLDGNAPAVKTQDPFFTVTCATPFSISAGFGFSTIRQKEFAIIKSAGGENNTSVSKFGTLSDSRYHPLPMALVHGRLADWWCHRMALHATVGIAGNIQGQDTGGSSAEFLIGGGISFLRTIYLSLGLHIGTKPELAGGFNEGDKVPSDITTMQGQVKRSYTKGLGFAVSFSKP